MSVSDAEWRSYTTGDFARYKAIVVPDPNCGSLEQVKFLDDTKAAWSPAVTGNIILIGTDPGYHATVPPIQPGAASLIEGGVSFAAAGNGTGLYYCLSCYYQDSVGATVEELSGLGHFEVRGNLECYNDAHLVANSSALRGVNDTALSNWSCSVHEVFSAYPVNGTGGFEPLVIAQGAKGTGNRTFADGTSGVPYVITNGATPAGCGNGVWEPAFGEECDSGPSSGLNVTLCTTSCKCLFGVVGNGTCATSTTKSSSSTTSGSPSITLFSSSLTSSTGSAVLTNSRYVDSCWACLRIAA